MANPQRENGHVRIANELVEQLAKVNLSPYEWRVLLIILRKTWAWGKKVDYVAVSQIATMTGLHKQHASRAKLSLLTKGLLVEQSGKIGFNKDYDKWAIKGESVTSRGDGIVTGIGDGVTDTGYGGVTNLGDGVTSRGYKSSPAEALQKKKETNKRKRKEDPYPHQIFDRWNAYKNRSIRKRNKESQEKVVNWKSHKLRDDGSMSPDVTSAITETLKAGHSVEEICGAIDNYATVLLSADYWWTHVWPLSTFLMVKYERKKDAEHKWWQFLPDNFDEAKYMTEDAKRKRERRAEGPVPLDLVKKQIEKERAKRDERKETA